MLSARSMRGMNTLLHPQGPEGEAVYWRRRAVIMFVVIAIIAVISLVTGRIRHGAGGAAAAGPTATAVVRTSGAGGSGDEGRCVLDELTLGITAPDGVAAGQAVDLTVELGAGAGAPCSLSLDDHALSVTVNSGTDEYWSTEACTDAAPSGQVAIMDADPVPLTVTWPGTHVDGACADTGEAVAAGTYAGTVGVAGGASATSQLTLS